MRSLVLDKFSSLLIETICSVRLELNLSGCLEDKSICGIVGVASTEGMKNRSARLSFMRMGLDIDSWRGWESTGLALVPEASLQPPLVYKRAINGRDFIQLNQVEKYLADIEKYSVAIGHNRAATTGRGNIIDHNAHPFQYGKITLVHNGHIRNTDELGDAQREARCQVDSAHVAFAMDALGEQEVLERVDGGFVFVWWNSENATLNIARNTERPLHMAFAEKENTFYWASELTELLHLLKDVNIDEEIGILYPKAWTWYQYNLKDLRSYTKTPFTKRQGRRHQTSGHVSYPAWGHGAGAGRGYELEGGVPGDKTDPTTSTTTSTASATSDKDAERDAAEIEEIRKTVSNQRVKDARTNGIPTSNKRIARAKIELLKLGIIYNSMRMCKPVSWQRYKNQENLGSVLARVRTTNQLVEVLQVRQQDYVEFDKIKAILVDCVNVRNGPNNDVRIIGVVSARMKDFAKKRIEARENAAAAATSTALDYEGPNGKKITMARFLELTQGGCANCETVLAPKMHNDILWVGQDERPLCEECGGDPGVLDMLGLSDTRSRHFAGNIH